jgi:hypothetical protein
MSGTNPLAAGQWPNIASLGAGNLAPGNGAAFGQGASNTRPLRGPPQAYGRQPYLGSAPQVVTLTGLGLGSGAGIVNQGSDADQSQGLVRLVVGLTPAPSGTLSLYFPIAPTPGQYVILADWSTPITPTVSVNNLLMAWSAARPLATGEVLLLAYQWAVSQ